MLDENEAIKDSRLLFKSLTVMALTIVGFMLHGALHLESSTIAISGAVILTLIFGITLEHILKDTK